jgi:hypothetical protein
VWEGVVDLLGKETNVRKRGFKLVLLSVKRSFGQQLLENSFDCVLWVDGIQVQKVSAGQAMHG